MPGSLTQRFGCASDRAPITRISCALQQLDRVPCGRGWQMRTPGRMVVGSRVNSTPWPDLAATASCPTRQADVIETLIGRHRRRVVVGLGRRDEDIGAAELDVDPPGPADDFAAQDIVQPGRGGFGVRTAQMDVVPGYGRHLGSPCIF